MGIEVDDSAVLGGESCDCLSVAIAGAAAIRLGVPSGKGEALATEGVGAEALRHSILECLVAHRPRNRDAYAAVAIETDGVGTPADRECSAGRASVAVYTRGGNGARARRIVVGPRQGVVCILCELHLVGGFLLTFIEIHRGVRLDGRVAHHILAL